MLSFFQHFELFPSFKNVSLLFSMIQLCYYKNFFKDILNVFESQNQRASGLLPNFLQWQRLGQAETRTRNLISVCPLWFYSFSSFLVLSSILSYFMYRVHSRGRNRFQCFASGNSVFPNHLLKIVLSPMCVIFTTFAKTQLMVTLSRFSEVSVLLH